MPLNKPTGDILNAGSDATPQPLGAATHGTSTDYSRADHVHEMPTAADVGAVADARQVIAGTGLTGGGDLSADRTLSVVYGTTAGTAAEGDDIRLSDSRTPTAHAASHATGGGDAITPSSIGAAPNTAANVQIFSTVGTFTWTKPAGAVRCRVQGWGGGGGGGSGRRGPTGEIRMGGGGGGSGAVFDQMILASAFGATETVIIGDGGNGGAARTVDSIDGASGATGSNSQFGTLIFAGGGAGGGGTITTGSAGGGSYGGNAGGGLTATSTAAVSGIPSATTSTGTALGSGSGGSGGMLSASASAGANGGAGGRFIVSGLTGGTAGSATGTQSGGAGSSTGTNSNGMPMGASGGGGGASTISGTAGTGGAGGAYGAGGGGGGASQNGVNSGGGGKGGQGLVVITSYFA